MSEKPSKWIIDLPYHEAVDKVIELNTKRKGKSHYQIGSARNPQVNWVGVYYIE